MNSVSEPTEAHRSGERAIRELCDPLAPGVEPMLARPAVGAGMGGALDGILAYPAGACWLLVTLGLTELDAKTSPDPQVSGHGFEFTWRIRRDRDFGEIPPAWATRVMVDLAERVRGGTAINPGDWFTTGRVLGGDPSATTLTSLAFVADRALTDLYTSPNGAFGFVQIVGLTAEQGRSATEAGGIGRIIADLSATDPLLPTDPHP